jgi:CheY-like chemotaxis protein
LVFIDLNMPQMDGFEVVQALNEVARERGGGGCVMVANSAQSFDMEFLQEKGF